MPWDYWILQGVNGQSMSREWGRSCSDFIEQNRVSSKILVIFDWLITQKQREETRRFNSLQSTEASWRAVSDKVKMLFENDLFERWPHQTQPRLTLGLTGKNEYGVLDSVPNDWSMQNHSTLEGQCLSGWSIGYFGAKSSSSMWMEINSIGCVVTNESGCIS